MIYFIPPEETDLFWPLISGHIQRALEHSEGEIALQDVRAKALEQRMGLLAIYDDLPTHGDNPPIAACVVEFMNYPRLTALRVVALGGERMSAWLDELLDFLNAWALENGMARIEQMGRPGWIRVLKKHGYTQRYIFMTKVLHG